MAKAIPWACTDAHARKRGEQTGLDTLVVHALNDVDYRLELVKSKQIKTGIGRLRYWHQLEKSVQINL